MADVVVTAAGTVAVQVIEPAALPVVIGSGEQGPPGPPGPPPGTEYPFPSPVSTWTISHSLGRLPDVSLFVGGVEVECDYTASATQVVVTWPSPTAGTALLL